MAHFFPWFDEDADLQQPEPRRTSRGTSEAANLLGERSLSQLPDPCATWPRRRPANCLSVVHPQKQLWLL